MSTPLKAAHAAHSVNSQPWHACGAAECTNAGVRGEHSGKAAHAACSAGSHSRHACGFIQKLLDNLDEVLREQGRMWHKISATYAQLEPFREFTCTCGIDESRVGAGSFGPGPLQTPRSRRGETLRCRNVSGFQGIGEEMVKILLTWQMFPLWEPPPSQTAARPLVRVRTLSNAT